MNAIKRYWFDFAAWVKGRNRRLQFQPIPVESWAERKHAYERAQKAHRGQADAYANLRKATTAALIQQITADADKCIAMTDTHPWLFRNPDAFIAAVKAIAERRAEDAQR